MVVVAGACYAFAVGGKALLLTGPAGAFWPAGGLAIAVLYVGGLRWWPAVLLGDLASLLGDVLSTELALPPAAALAEAAGDMGRALVAVIILRRLAGPHATLERLRDVGAVLVAVATGAAISATVAMLALAVGGLIEVSGMSLFWRGWWLGDVSGGLVVLPLALAWTRPPAPAWRGRGAWESVVMIGAVAALSVAAVSAQQPLTYLVFPAFIWAALRFGPQGATVAVAVAAVIAVWAASNDLGPFVEHAPTDSALNLQLYITLASLTTLCLAAIVSERQRAARELAASRARIAAARELERRRLEGELHDSAQNRIFALQVRLRLAQERTADAGPELAAAFGELIDEAGAVGEDLRRIAHGLSPPLLASDGLATALKAETKHSAIPVSIVSSDIGLSEPHIERAVYLCCLESIQNAAKHAGRDATVTVRFQNEAGELAFSISDTGSGFDPRTTTPGAGLASLRERVDTVGGQIEVSSAPRRGTTVSGIVPWPARSPRTSNEQHLSGARVTHS